MEFWLCYLVVLFMWEFRKIQKLCSAIAIILPFTLEPTTIRLCQKVLSRVIGNLYVAECIILILPEALDTIN